MRQRTASRLAWSLFGMAVLLGVVAIWLAAVQDGDLRYAITVTVLATIPFPLIGAMIASRFPRNAIGWIFCAVGLFQAINVFSSEYVHYTLFTAPGSLPFVEAAAVGAEVAWMPSLALLTTFLLLLFPHGRLPSPRWQWAAWLAGTGIALVLIGAGGGALAVPVRALVSEDPVAFPAWALVALAAGGLMVLLAAIASVTSLVIRFRRSRGEERQQLKWVVFAGTFAFVVIAIQFLPVTFPSFLEPLTGLGLLAIPVASGIAILKHRLYDVDLVIRKTVVFGVLAAFITAAYFVIVIGVPTLVFGAGGSGPVGLMPFVAAAVLAISFQPIRRWASHLANRLVYGRRATPYEVLSEFSQRMAQTYAAEDALSRMARILGEGTGAAEAAVWLRVGGELRRSATWPASAGSPQAVRLEGDDVPSLPGAERTFAVRHHGELLGALTVTAQRGETVGGASEGLARDLVSQAGLVLRNVRLIEELRESRQRLVAAQDEERRRLERNIHDGAQQQLVALSVKMRLLKMLTRKDPAKAEDLVDQLQAESQDALENLRDLARGIYPPLLADQGLAAAVEAQARKIAVPVEVERNGVERYPAEIEAGVYFCILEALQNVAKYAEASRVEIRLDAVNGDLRFSVSDDGRGFDPSTAAGGTGLMNMRDRVEALGGSLEVLSVPAEGTVVTGTIPLGSGR